MFKEKNLIVTKVRHRNSPRLGWRAWWCEEACLPVYESRIRDGQESFTPVLLPSPNSVESSRTTITYLSLTSKIEGHTSPPVLLPFRDSAEPGTSVVELSDLYRWHSRTERDSAKPGTCVADCQILYLGQSRTPNTTSENNWKRKSCLLSNGNCSQPEFEDRAKNWRI